MKDEGIKIPAVFQSSINGSGGGTKEIKKTSDISQMIQKLRKRVADLGPFGILSVIAAVFIFTTLFNGSFENNSGKTTTNVLETKHQEQINTLFASIEGVTLESVNLSYKTVSDSSSATIFASNQTNTVSNGVVIVYRGVLKAPYDVTNAISLLLDVPIHQISLLNASELGGN